MSYIRCLSNPEQLYIYGGMDNKVCITGKAIKKALYAPTDDFDNLLCECDRGLGTPDSEMPPMESGCLRVYSADYGHVVLENTEDDWRVMMWYVTWCYIVRNHSSDHCEFCKAKKERSKRDMELILAAHKKRGKK